MQTATLGWNYDKVSISSLDELTEYMHKLEYQGKVADYPFFGELVIQHCVLMISFGRSLSAVRYYDTAIQKDDYSLGEESDELEVIFYGGHWTEVSKRELIPYLQAREAMREFYLTGTKPTNIQWQWGD